VTISEQAFAMANLRGLVFTCPACGQEHQGGKDSARLGASVPRHTAAQGGRDDLTELLLTMAGLSSRLRARSS
jgi:hypothetical protein